VRKRRTIRGIRGDRVTITVTPDPLDEALGLPPIPLLHVSVTDGCGDSCTTDGNGKNANVIGVFTLAAARKLHAALGAVLAAPRKRGRR
jgi:hypothetical protein